MNIIQTSIEGVVIVEPRLFRDARGYFFESFSQRDFSAKVRAADFVQDNESRSTYGVLRGLHFQRPPHAQSKLDAVRAAERFWTLRWTSAAGVPLTDSMVAVELTEENHLQLFIPRGFAHGFAVLSEEAVFQYKCDNYYAPEADGGISIRDAELGIDWRIPAAEAILSEKDTRHPLLRDFVSPFEYTEDLYKL